MVLSKILDTSEHGRLSPSSFGWWGVVYCQLKSRLAGEIVPWLIEKLSLQYVLMLSSCFKFTTS